MALDPNRALTAHMSQIGGISQAQYDAFVKSLPIPAATADTTPTQAAWLLGIQYTLLQLRSVVR